MKFKSTLLAGLLAVSIAAPALAANDAPAAAVTQFTAADTQMLFKQDAKPVELAALSTQEMKDTQGAALGGAILALSLVTNGTKPRIPPIIVCPPPGGWGRGWDGAAVKEDSAAIGGLMPRGAVGTAAAVSVSNGAIGGVGIQDFLKTGAAAGVFVARR